MVCAALTSNTTLTHGEIWTTHLTSGGYHPLWRCNPTDFCETRRHLPRAQREHRAEPITWLSPSSRGLFPLRSPLLGESLLLSFPPVNDMLKFTGCWRKEGGEECCSLFFIPSPFSPKGFNPFAICVQDFHDSKRCSSHDLSRFAALFNHHVA